MQAVGLVENVFDGQPGAKSSCVHVAKHNSTKRQEPADSH